MCTLIMYTEMATMQKKTKYQNMTTATDLTKKETPIKETPMQRRARWHNMTPEQIIKATPMEDLRKYANRGAPLAMRELKRRTATAPQKVAATIRDTIIRDGWKHDEQPGVFNTQAEILSERYADRIIPDHDIDIGV